MGFHRLTVPVYAGGLRGGDDYINNAIAGTPASADGALGAGTYIGSYFFGDTDQVTGAAVNRGLKALANNCDLLDNAIVAADLDIAAVAGDLATFIAALAATATGEGLVGAALKAGTFFGLSAGTVGSQLTTLLSYANREYAVRTVTAADVIAFTDKTLILDTVTGGVPYALQLPNPASAGHRFYFAAKDGSDIETNTVTLTRAGAEKIDGVAADYVLDSANGRWILESDGTDWYLWSC